MSIALLPDRGVLEVAGPDRVAFLQGLVSNDVAAIPEGQAAWTALLTPQGKWLADFFAIPVGEVLLLDVERAQAAGLAQRLSRFRLRSKVTLRDASAEWHVHAAWGARPSAACVVVPDPRLDGAGFRVLSPVPLPTDATEADYDRHRLALGLPDGSRDMEGEKSVLLEGGFDDSVPDDVPRAPVSTRKALESLVTMAMRGPADVADALAVTVPAGPTRFESQCGFKLRGARIQDACAVGAGVQQLGPARDVARVTPRDATPLVLFVLDNGNGVVLPAIPGFIGALKFDGYELIDVAYEPSDNTDRAVHFRSQARELRALRQVVATASREGVFWLQRDKAATLARRMQVMKGVDPSLAVYAAYAYDDLHETRRLAETDRYLRGDLGASLFDVAMLAGRLDRRSAAEWPPLFGPFPLLAQGWAYLRARRIELAHDGAALQPHLADSLWTVFGPGGVEHLRSHLFREAEPWQPG